ncbi:hypothetical protein Tco_0757139 [Tanacetum coccineum]
MDKSTETLRLLTNEQKAFRDNLRKSGLGYNGPYVLSQAYTKIPKLYRAYELCNKNEQLHVFDSEDTLEDAEQSRLKMNEVNSIWMCLFKLSDCKVTKPRMTLMPSANPMLVDLNEMENVFKKLFELLEKKLENDLDETYKQNELLKDQLLEASLTEDIKNLVITSCVEIRNKDLHDETERISKEI